MRTCLANRRRLPRIALLLPRRSSERPGVSPPFLPQLCMCMCYRIPRCWTRTPCCRIAGMQWQSGQSVAGRRPSLSLEMPGADSVSKP
eukprot:1529889-Rhodomonas_salina.2